MIYSTLTSKGQTTIPLEIRKALHLKTRQRLVYKLKGNEVILKAEESGLLDFYGCLKSKLPPPNKKALRKTVHKTIGENAAKEGRH